MLYFLVLITVHHADNNRKNNFLILGEGPMVLKEALKKFNINHSKVKTKFCLSLHYNADISYFFVNGKKSLNLKPTIKIITFQLNFVSKVYLMDLVLLSLQKYF